MCSFCDMKSAQRAELNGATIYVKKFGAYGDMCLWCDSKHEHHKISTLNHVGGGYRIYWCPTCGKHLK